MSHAPKSIGSSFRPLQTISEERSTHGLRYGDYTRYRKHCAHKTHRLRSSLKITHGKGRDFKKLPPMAPESAKDGHLQLLLFETERAWAHAQELSAPQESRRSTARYRRSHNYLSRLLAVARSPELPLPLSSQSTVELIVYALIHTARFNLRRPSASTAAYYGIEHEAKVDDTSAYPLVQLSVAYALLDELEQTARTSKDVALARAFKDEIGPEIRWCVHEFNRGSGGHVALEKHVLAWRKREWDIGGIAGDVAPAYAERVVRGYGALVGRLRAEAGPAGKKQILEELMWDGEPVPVRNPELVDVLLKVQEATRKLQVDTSGEEAGGTKVHRARGRLARYDGVLQSLSDAVDQARKLVEAQQVSGVSANAVPGAGKRDVSFMHGYLTYRHLTCRIERDLLLLSALSDGGEQAAPQPTAAALHLLSGVLQSLSQTLTLPIVDESADLSTALSVRLSHAKAVRALHLARAYVGHGRWAEGVALTQRGQLHTREARTTLSVLGASPPLGFYAVDGATLAGVADALAREEDQYKRAWFGHNGGAGAVADGDQTHKKPLFFDIAFNYVEMPVERLRARAGMAARAEETELSGTRARAEDEAHGDTPPPRGLTRLLLGSWWSRR